MLGEAEVGQAFLPVLSSSATRVCKLKDKGSFHLRLFIYHWLHFKLESTNGKR